LDLFYFIQYSIRTRLIAMMVVFIITVSDSISKGEYEDLSGPRIEAILKEAFPAIKIQRTVVPDEKEALRKALSEGLGHDFIITTGGTGFSSRDITPEVSKAFCDRDVPGIAEILRQESYKETPHAMLSRGAAGIKEQTIIVNFPGSVKAAELCTRLLLPVMEHGKAMIRGKKH
jgi:molybdenum cofactor synthesis domain-containing protein